MRKAAPVGRVMENGKGVNKQQLQRLQQLLSTTMLQRVHDVETQRVFSALPRVARPPSTRTENQLTGRTCMAVPQPSVALLLIRPHHRVSPRPAV